MRLVYVITRADAVGGASIHVRDLARRMIARGARATVLVGGEGPVTEQLKAAGVPYRPLRFLVRPIQPWTDGRAITEVREALKDLRPDLISTHTAKAGWIGRAAARKLGVPVLYTPHGWSIGQRISPIAGRVFAWAERSAAKWCSAIVCVCEQERRLALSQSIAPDEKLVVIHNGVRDIDPSLRARPDASPVRLCCVARFAPPKDHGTLLAALGSLGDLPWEMDLVGDGPDVARAQEQARKIGMSERVRFHGYVAEPAEVLSRAQVFVLSSRSEAFPRSILEALRAGLPVVASDVGGVGEAIASGSTGLLVPAQDPASLAKALRELIEDSQLRLRMGALARSAYESRFRLDRMIDLTSSVYARLLK